MIRNIVERLKRGEHVRGDDKSLYALEGRMLSRIANILSHHVRSQNQARSHLARTMGGEEKVREAIASGSKNKYVRHYLEREKHLRHAVINRLEDMLD
jgi:hypothetical protein